MRKFSATLQKLVFVFSGVLVQQIHDVQRHQRKERLHEHFHYGKTKKISIPCNVIGEPQQW
jgi:hypothetical protein